MKKYIILFCSFGIIFSMIFFVNIIIENNDYVNVDTNIATPTSVSSTVTCSGNIVVSDTDNNYYGDYISVYDNLINTNKSVHDKKAGVPDGEMYVILEASQEQAAKLSVGQDVVVSGSGFNGNEYNGTITYIDSSAKQKLSLTSIKTVVNAVVNVDFPENTEVRAGYDVKGVVTTDTLNDVILLPYEAVKEDENGKEYIMEDIDNVAKKTYVLTGEEFENGVVADQGVENGDIIILNPDDTKDGQRVELNDK